MEIQTLGAWGEFLGGISGLVAAIGVIATLLYLARQIHQNTKSVQSANYSTWIESLSAANDLLMQANDFMEDAVQDTRELNHDEYWRFHNACMQIFHAFEAVYLFRQNETVDEEYFEARMRLLKNGVINNRPGYRKWWDAWAAEVLDTRFVHYVEQHLKDQSTHVLPTASSTT